MKQIENFPDYLISFNATVWNSRSNRWLKQSKNSDGYFCVNLCKDKKNYNTLVHRLLAETYIPKVEGCNVVDHLDKTRQNNSLSNLRWATNRMNSHNRKDQSELGHNITVDKRGKNISYQVRIEIDGKKISKSFRTHEEALEYRDIELANLTYDA